MYLVGLKLDRPNYFGANLRASEASELSHVRVQSRFQKRMYICGRTSSYMHMLGVT